jgi:hypothetical protein
MKSPKFDEYPVHPAANAFPMMSQDEIRELASLGDNSEEPKRAKGPFSKGN